MADKTDNPGKPKGGILAKISAVQQAVGTIAKNGVNPHFNSRYATLDRIWEEVKPALRDARLAVFCTTEAVAADAWQLTTHVADIDTTDEVSASFPIPAKGSPQQLGSAMTFARRYTLCALLQIVAADEDDDGNAASFAAGAKKAAPSPF